MKSKLKDNGQRIWKMMLKASVTLSENREKQIGEKHRNEVITSCKYDFIILPDCLEH